MNTVVDPVAGLRHAKRVVGYMAIGVMPSDENAAIARRAVEDASQDAEVDRTATSTTMHALGAIGAGIAPSVEMCRASLSEINELMDRLSETSRATLRARFESARG